MHAVDRIRTWDLPLRLRQVPRRDRRCRFVAAGTMLQAIWICRVICPLLSQYVFLLAMTGSSIAGWRLLAVSIAREVIAWSPGVGCQSRLQNRHEYGDLLSASFAFSQGPLSIFASTAAIGVGP